MSLGIAEAISASLRDRSVRFVFPSEICASFWLSRAACGAAASDGGGAVEARRFLGWDSFKESASESGAAPPADAALRWIFAADLLARNASSPFLRAVVPQAFAGEAAPFAPWLAARLSRLGSLPEDLALGGFDREALARDGTDPALADWLAIRDAYARFLADIGYREPSFAPRALGAGPGRTLLFFPELIEDFDEYAPGLTRSSSTTILRLPPSPPRVSLSVHDSALGELRDVLARIGRLLDSGTRHDAIALTVPGLEAYRPWLERESILMSVPISIRSGAPLSATSGGRLFSSLRDAATSGFSYASMRDLLVSPAYPWRRPAFARDLLAAGARLHAIAPWPEGGQLRDPWEASLRDPDLLSGYRALKHAVLAISRAPDFASLRSAYSAFRAEFLSAEASDWDEATDLSLARCVVELGCLARAQATAGLRVPSPFALFLRALEDKRYVSARRDGGVPVYEWRVAAGIAPDRHFVLDASQASLSAPRRRYDFLPEGLRKRLGAGDGDAAAAFIAAYALSGEDVRFSCPVRGFDGERAPHGAAARHARAGASADAAEANIAAHDIAEPPLGDDDPSRAYATEAAWLRGKGPRPKRLHAVQKRGLAAADGAMAARGGGALLGEEARELAASRLRRRDEERYSLDATSVDAYSSCPYAYLYLRLLGAGPEPSGIAFADALLIGETYHAALALLFARMRDEDGRFRPDRVADYRGWIDECLDGAFEELAYRRGPFVRAVLETYAARLSAFLASLLDAE
ncbi:MAG: PD-(D/E)XK nuclease family protein, partial [Spirochaetaceae bacterium]|nr:PD-(D/E)XK nuclease family protein [Spirochaetaceae bacterium]